MPTLHVRNVPETLYRRIQKIADDEGRSLTAEVVQLLDHGIRARQARGEVAAVLERVGKQARAIALPAGWKDAATLVRAGRRR
ncbi:MAG: hypothetical protein JSS28_04200 [Proteobacteria bacterium]|nr:hypothetical protein [Pseudomonadota bacterium]